MTVVKNIYQRIQGVMEEVHYIQKEDKKVNGQYRFVSHDSVSAKIHPALVKHGIVVITDVQEFKQDGNRTEVTMNITFVNVDSPEDRFSFKSFGYGIDAGDKGPGKAVSYATKYAFLKIFCLETGDDVEIDANAKHKTKESPKIIAADFNDSLEVLSKKMVEANVDDRLLTDYLEAVNETLTEKKTIKEIAAHALSDSKRFAAFTTAYKGWSAKQTIA